MIRSATCPRCGRLIADHDPAAATRADRAGAALDAAITAIKSAPDDPEAFARFEAAADRFDSAVAAYLSDLAAACDE